MAIDAIRKLFATVSALELVATVETASMTAIPNSEGHEEDRCNKDVGGRGGQRSASHRSFRRAVLMDHTGHALFQ